MFRSVIGPVFPKLLGLALAAALLPACVQQPNNQAEIALQRFRQDFAPDRPTALASTVEVTAPTLEARDARQLAATGADASSRPVTLTLRDHKTWDDVQVVWVDSGNSELRDEDAAPYLSMGVRSRSADLDATGPMLTIVLHDVELKGRPQPVETLTVTLDFRRSSASVRGLVANTNALINRPPGISFVGGD
jgi:hypothetical protein